jgi:PQQ-like domain
VTRGRATWLRRGGFWAMLAALAVAPGPVSAARPCAARACHPVGHLRWVRPLPGAWVAQRGLAGTTPALGDAYAAMDSQVAVIGLGTTVHAYRSASGAPLWASSLAGFRAGSRLVAVRVWPGVVTVGVTLPGRMPGAAGSRREVVLSAATGRLIRSYPAASFGGAVSADAGHTVIVGPTAVTSYDNRTGAVRWRRPTGAAAQAWQVDGHQLYLTVAAGGYLSGRPVRALRRVSLRTGAQRLIRPLGRSFRGVLSRAFDGVVVFTSARATIAYSGATGVRLWRRAGAVPENADAAGGQLYLGYGHRLVAVNPWTGVAQARLPGRSAAGLSAAYAVRDGVALGLAPGGPGRAWGYDVAARRVRWTDPAVPWPHFFVDLSGIGGSAAATSKSILLAACRQLGGPVPAGAGRVCRRPELVALRW